MLLPNRAVFISQPNKKTFPGLYLNKLKTKRLRFLLIWPFGVNEMFNDITQLLKETVLIQNDTWISFNGIYNILPFNSRQRMVEFSYSLALSRLQF